MLTHVHHIAHPEKSERTRSLSILNTFPPFQAISIGCAVAKFTPPREDAVKVTLDAAKIFAQLSAVPKVPAKPETLRGTRVRSQAGDSRPSATIRDSRNRSRPSSTSAMNSVTTNRSKPSAQSPAKPSRSVTSLNPANTRAARAAHNPRSTLSQSSAHSSLTTARSQSTYNTRPHAAIAKTGRDAADLRRAVLTMKSAVIAADAAKSAVTESPVDTAVNVFCGRLTADTDFVELAGFRDAKQTDAISDSQRWLWQQFWEKAFEPVASIERVHLTGYFGSDLWIPVANYVLDEKKQVVFFKIDTDHMPAYFGTLTTLGELYSKWLVIKPNAKVATALEVQLKRINDRTTAFRRLLMQNPHIHAIEFSDYDEAAWANAIGAFKVFGDHLTIGFANGAVPQHFRIGHQRLDVELNSYRDNLLLRPDQIGDIRYVRTNVNDASALDGVQPFFMYALRMLALVLTTANTELDLLQLFIDHVRNTKNIPLMMFKSAAKVNFADAADIDRFKTNFAKLNAMFAALCVASFEFSSEPGEGVHLCEGQQFVNGVLRCHIRPLPKELQSELDDTKVDDASAASSELRPGTPRQINKPFYRNCEGCRAKWEHQENRKKELAEKAALLETKKKEKKPIWRV